MQLLNVMKFCKIKHIKFQDRGIYELIESLFQKDLLDNLHSLKIAADGVINCYNS